MDVKIRTGKAADRGGWLLMPLRENVPDPGDGEWQLASCPECGRECWRRQLPEGFTEEMFVGRLCTMCALKAALW